jgi:hypothetical protein
MHEASINHALFPDDRAAERLNPAIAGHPDLVNGSKSLTVHAGMTGLAENAFINTNNQSHSITAIVDVPAKGTDGALLVQGGRFGGWAMYVNNGKPFYTYNWLRLEALLRYLDTNVKTRERCRCLRLRL